MAATREVQPGTARDSLVVGLGTAVSRLTGLVRVVMVGAILGPTTFGDTFQLTNSLPNLVYYGFLAGSLFSSLLVPALVKHVDAGDPDRTARMAGGFLGTSWLAMLVVVPVVFVAIPPVLGVLTPGEGATASRQAALLLVLMCPQVFLYALSGASAAVLNAHRRFALAAVAPAVENVGMMAVLLTTWLAYGSVAAQSSQPTGVVVLLGLGSTTAVAANAALAWAGARTSDVTVRPRAGWRDPEVRDVVRRAVLSVLQAALLALQMLVLLLLAGRAAGGTAGEQQQDEHLQCQQGRLQHGQDGTAHDVPDLGVTPAGTRTHGHVRGARPRPGQRRVGRDRRRGAETEQHDDPRGLAALRRDGAVRQPGREQHGHHPDVLDGGRDRSECEPAVRVEDGGGGPGQGVEEHLRAHQHEQQRGLPRGGGPLAGRQHPEDRRNRDEDDRDDDEHGQPGRAEEPAGHACGPVGVARVDVLDQGGHEQRREQRSGEEPVVDEVRQRVGQLERVAERRRPEDRADHDHPDKPGEAADSRAQADHEGVTGGARLHLPRGGHQRAPPASTAGTVRSRITR